MNVESEGPLKVLVAGAGTMGHGLALLMARAGHQVVLMDVNDEILQKAVRLIEGPLRLFVEMGKLDEASVPEIMGRIQTATAPDALEDQDLVMESITEDPDIKRAFLQEAAERCPAGTIVASNTS